MTDKKTYFKTKVESLQELKVLLLTMKTADKEMTNNKGYVKEIYNE